MTASALETVVSLCRSLVYRGLPPPHALDAGDSMNLEIDTSSPAQGSNAAIDETPPGELDDGGRARALDGDDASNQSLDSPSPADGSNAAREPHASAEPARSEADGAPRNGDER